MEQLLDTRAQPDAAADLEGAIRAEVARILGSDAMLVLDCASGAEMSPSAVNMLCALIEEAIICIVQAGGLAAGSRLRIALTVERGRMRLTLRGGSGAHGGGVDGSRVEAMAAALGGFARVDHTSFGGLEVTALFRRMGAFAATT